MKNILITFLSIGCLSSYAVVDTEPSPELYEGAIETPNYNSINNVKTTADMVRESQHSLHERGYSTGTIDGVLGSRTRSAIMDFQKENSLKATGRLDKETLERLDIESDYNKKTFNSNQYSE